MLELKFGQMICILICNEADNAGTRISDHMATTHTHINIYKLRGNVKRKLIFNADLMSVEM